MYLTFTNPTKQITHFVWTLEVSFSAINISLIHEISVLDYKKFISFHTIQCWFIKGKQHAK